MPNFTGITARMVADGCLVKPILGQFLSSNEPFSLNIRTAKPLDRDPDGWFHASTHPGLTDGELLAYLAGRGPGDHDDLGYVGRLSVMFGTIMHEVVRQALVKMKIIIPVPQGTCAACGLEQPRRCREHGASHPETRSRGHLDGILWFGAVNASCRPLTSPYVHGFDFKSIKPMLLIKAPDMDEGFFRERWPKYWWQAQEYMRLTGLVRFIMLFMAMGNPWDMREYHIQADLAAQMEIEAKYRRVLDLATGW
jgi:hypothetical protein